MKLAYELRSNLVHGSDAESIIKKIKKKEICSLGEEYKMDNFIFEIQAHIRLAICRIIQELYSSLEDKKSIDWERLILKK